MKPSRRLLELAGDLPRCIPYALPMLLDNMIAFPRSRGARGFLRAPLHLLPQADIEWRAMPIPPPPAADTNAPPWGLLVHTPAPPV